MNSKTFTRELFGREIEIIVYNPIENCKEVIDSMYIEALRLQKIFSFYDKNSEISILNKKRSLKVSGEFLDVLTKALKFSEITNGKYDVSLGKNILKRKTGKKFTETHNMYKNVKISEGVVSLENKDAMIDLGSIAKGFITDRLSDFLLQKGVNEFLIDSRGDIIFTGNLNHVIGVQNPRNKEESICTIKVKNVGVATSGDYNQFSETEEETHILNRNEDVISATVVSKNLEDADLFATVIFVSTREEIKNILDKNKNVKAMIISKDLNPEFYNNFEELIV